MHTPILLYTLTCIYMHTDKQETRTTIVYLFLLMRNEKQKSLRRRVYYCV